MDLSDLRLFRAMAEEGSVTRAAQRLHTVQSNVTTRLRLLEESLGTPLFDRINRRLVITPPEACWTGTPTACSIWPTKPATRCAAPPHRKGCCGWGRWKPPPPPPAGGDRRLPPPPSPGRVAPCHLTPPGWCRTCWPISSTPPSSPARSSIPISNSFRWSSRIWCSSAPPTGRRSPSADLVARGPVELITFREGCSYRQRLLDWLWREGVPVARSSTFGTFEAILGCVSAGNGGQPGAAGHPRPGTQDMAQPALRVHPLPPEVAKVTTLMVWHRARSRQPAREAFAESLLRLLGVDSPLQSTEMEMNLFPTSPGRPPASATAIRSWKYCAGNFADRRRVLEVGSGTGQHAVHFAAAPSSSGRPATGPLAAGHPPVARRGRLAQHAAAARTGRDPAPGRRHAFDGVFTANTLHIMGWAEVEAFFAGLPGAPHADAR